MSKLPTPEIDLTPDVDGVLMLDLPVLPGHIEAVNPDDPDDLVIYVPIRPMVTDHA